MEIGQRVWMKEDVLAKLRKMEPKTVEAFEAQGYLTVSRRFKLGCNEPYWIGFKETPGVVFEEEYFEEVLPKTRSESS